MRRVLSRANSEHKGPVDHPRGLMRPLESEVERQKEEGRPLNPRELERKSSLRPARSEVEGKRTEPRLLPTPPRKGGTEGKRLGCSLGLNCDASAAARLCIEIC